MSFRARHHHENLKFSTKDGAESVGVVMKIVVSMKVRGPGAKMSRPTEICSTTNSYLMELEKLSNQEKPE